MATIEASALATLGVAQRMIGIGAVNVAAGATSSQLASQTTLLSGKNNVSNIGSGQIHLMKGVAPTDFTGLTLFSDRETDVITSFNTGPNAAGDFSVTVHAGVNPVIIQTNYVVSTGSGICTWFWWTCRQMGGGVYLATPLIHQIIGTVGTVGSGSDLEIPDTNLVSGNAYRITNLRLQFPSIWTY